LPLAASDLVAPGLLSVEELLSDADADEGFEPFPLAGVADGFFA